MDRDRLSLGAAFMAFSLVGLATAASVPCKFSHMCFVDPCDQGLAVCQAFANQALQPECSVDYCHGCDAKWMLNGVDYTKECQADSQSGAAPSGSSQSASVVGAPEVAAMLPTIQMPAKPAEMLSGLPESKPAEGSVFGQKPSPRLAPVELEPLTMPPRRRPRPSLELAPAALQPATSDCPNVFCLVDPCQVSSCSGNSEATCSPDYCSGCAARWTDAGGNDVTKSCSKTQVAAAIRAEAAAPASRPQSGSKPPTGLASALAAMLKPETRGAAFKRFRGNQGARPRSSGSRSSGSRSSGSRSSGPRSAVPTWLTNWAQRSGMRSGGWGFRPFAG